MGRGGWSPGRRRARWTVPIAVATVSAVVLGACTGDDDDDRPPPETDAVTLTVAAYLGLGPVGELLAEYDRAHPEVVLDIAPLDYASSRWPSLESDLEAGAELTDLVAYGDAGAVLAAAELFVDLREHGLDARVADVHPWALVGGTDAAGRLVGFPTEIAPAALCFRRDLLAAAGIAADRDELATLLAADGGGWDVYFDLGRRYHAATGRAWFDIAGTIWDSMAAQLPTGYTALDGTALAHADAELRARWDLLTDAVRDGLSAHQRPLEWDDGASFADGTFATTPCSPSFVEVIQDVATRGGAGPETGWDVVDAFPGGGGELWTSTTAYLAIPASSGHPDEVAAVLDWLVQPAQQARLHRPGSGLPSTRAAIAQVAAEARPSAFFGDAVLEQVFAARAEHVPPHRSGRYDSVVLLWFGTALNAWEAGRLPSADAAWEQAIGDMHIVVSGRNPLDVRPPT